MVIACSVAASSSCIDAPVENSEPRVGSATQEPAKLVVQPRIVVAANLRHFIAAGNSGALKVENHGG